MLVKLREARSQKTIIRFIPQSLIALVNFSKGTFEKKIIEPKRSATSENQVLQINDSLFLKKNDPRTARDCSGPPSFRKSRLKFRDFWVIELISINH